ncbi:hypothetical protein [Fusobacterium gastrosuis]|uniref:hypothetical protein n=1 Tax=Fusobacterium gastrosuis TaxID=1755100 RepID=UPI0029792C5F|nr:hypothetical protein [Fusobacteriaceae bacterium]MDY5714301.1 hypothetical protein [Fusobacterium gastrosuis]
MEIKKNGFYLIKNEFFKKFEENSLPFQKNGRPVYYCIQDKYNDKIFWVIALTTKLNKVEKAFEKAGGEEKCKIYCRFPSDKKSAFNIGDIFPITKEYVEREFIKTGKHYQLKDSNLIEKIEKKAITIIKIKMTNDNANNKGINVQKIYKQLSEEINLKIKIETENLKDETKEISKEQKEVEKKNPLIEKIQARRENKENSILTNKK